MRVSYVQAEVKSDQQDWRGSEAAYERAMAESKELSLDLLQGLTGVLVADSRPERAVDVIRGAEKQVSQRSGVHFSITAFSRQSSLQR